MIRNPNRKPPGLRSTDDEWLRPQEIISHYGIGRTRLYTWLAAGDLPSTKLGKTRHVRRSDLDRFLESMS
jgi:excisionase family DNA binding protein